MIKRFLFLIIIFVAVTACTTNEIATPTPFSESDPVTDLTTSEDIVPVAISQLIESPETFEGATLLVNGRYNPLPQRVCSTTHYKSPATWNLSANEGQVLMTGFATQLNSLLPDNTDLTVNGVWRQWNGPVGCGKSSVVEQVWYLDVYEIVSPNPLANVTLTPTVPGSSDEIADAGQANPEDDVEAEPQPNSDPATAPPPLLPQTTPQSNATPTPFTSSNPNATAVVTAVTPTNNDDEDDDDDDDDDDDEDDDDNSSGPLSTPTPIATGLSSGSNTPTPTATNASSNPSNPPTSTPISSLASPTPGPNNVNNGTLPASQILSGDIDNSEVHVWNINVQANETITVSVASQPSVDIILTLIDPLGNIIVNAQNNAPAGQVETIANRQLATAGEYDLQIETISQTSSNYLITVSSDVQGGVSTVDSGELSPFQLGFELLNALEPHVWEIDVQANDVITVSVGAKPTIDVQLTLIDPTGNVVVNKQNNASIGEVETIGNQTLTMTGLYRLQIDTAVGAAGEYVATVYSDSSFPFIFKEILTYGDSDSTTLAEEADDYHLFYGDKGDSVTITVDPSSSDADLFITLWSDDGDIAESDEPDLGATETITFTLPDDGMYAIQVADWDLLDQAYTISLTKN